MLFRSKSDRVRASTRYHDLQTNDAAFRSLREVRNQRTFSKTFSRTWSGYGAKYSGTEDEPDPGPGVQVRVGLESWVIELEGGDLSSSSDISVRSSLM